MNLAGAVYGYGHIAQLQLAGLEEEAHLLCSRRDPQEDPGDFRGKTGIDLPFVRDDQRHSAEGTIDFGSHINCSQPGSGLHQLAGGSVQASALEANRAGDGAAPGGEARGLRKTLIIGLAADIGGKYYCGKDDRAVTLTGAG